MLEAQRIGKMGNWERDFSDDSLHWSDQVYRIFGLDPGSIEPSLEYFFNSIHPDDVEKYQEAGRRGRSGEAPFEVEHRAVLTDGSVRHLREAAEYIYDSEGNLARAVGVVQDVTDVRQAQARLEESLKEKDLLLREIHHRVMNNLQIVAGLLYFQAQRMKDPEDAVVMREGRDRIRAMMLVHSKLYRSQNLSEIEIVGYLDSLAQQIASSYSRDEVTLLLQRKAGELLLPVEIVTPCGLLVSELISNSFKHAFPDGRRGQIRLGVELRGNQLVLTVEDDGVGFPSQFNAVESNSFGWRLINGLCAQIGGVLKRSSGPGASVSVSFPHSEY